MNIQRIAQVGALVGLYEAIAIVRWDWLMDDLRGWRIALGLGHALIIIAINAGLFALLGALVRKNLVVTGALYTAIVYGARLIGEDRFESQSYYAAGAILLLLLLHRVWPWVGRLLAVALATPGLWGRVPVYTTALDEQIAFLIPGAIITVLAGVVLAQAPQRSSQKITWATAILALFGLSGAVADLAGAGRTTGEQPNVLFILVDTLRQDHVQPYGDATPTPGFKRLSEEGTRYADAITVVPKTTQSVAAFQTGKYPVSNGVRILKDSLQSDQDTLAETLGNAGYSTAAFVHNGWVMRGRGFEQGFDQFWSFFELERVLPLGINIELECQ